MHTKEQLLELHSEHQEWQSKINFYKAELKSFDNELLGLAKQITSGDKMAAIEHFQNQFIIQNEVLDIMRHDFKQFENEIEFIQEHAIDKTAGGIHELKADQLEKLSSFEKVYHQLRDEFHEFAKHN
jgi:hypothetical protein